MSKDAKHTGLAGEVSMEQMSAFFKVLSDKTRLSILMELLDASLCVMHISERVGMSQSAISHQLAILRKADLVRVKRNGKTLVYSISDEHVRLMLDMAMLHINEEGKQ
ncbi:MAG: winged helix-turn-helix transcriptional regulator [Clostridia bacterium]|nr:winged helix-turn-helix transcriptional regulator [Clostridia bacterium]